MRDGILMKRTNTRPTRAGNGLSEGGSSLLEVLTAASLLAIALLGHTSSIIAKQRLGAEQRARSTAMLAMEPFTERMRSGEDFVELFERLNNLQELSRRSPAADPTPVLREDLPLAPFGLPADLNEDGLIPGQSPSSSAVQIRGGTPASMALYAPGANLSVHGGDEVFGSFIASTITIAGNSRFHYDNALGETVEHSKASIERLDWRDLEERLR
jgi:hypothetical protein